MKVFSCALIVCFLAFNILGSEGHHEEGHHGGHHEGFNVRQCFHLNEVTAPEDVKEEFKDIFPDSLALLCCVHFGHIKSETCNEILNDTKSATPEKFFECFKEAGPEGTCKTIKMDSSKSDIDECHEELKTNLDENCCLRKGKPIFNPESCGKPAEEDKCSKPEVRKFIEAMCIIHQDKNKDKACESLPEITEFPELKECYNAYETLGPCASIMNHDHHHPKPSEMKACSDALDKFIEEHSS